MPVSAQRLGILGQFIEASSLMLSITPVLFLPSQVKMSTVKISRPVSNADWKQVWSREVSFPKASKWFLAFCSFEEQQPLFKASEQIAFVPVFSHGPGKYKACIELISFWCLGDADNLTQLVGLQVQNVTNPHWKLYRCLWQPSGTSNASVHHLHV